MKNALELSSHGEAGIALEITTAEIGTRLSALLEAKTEMAEDAADIELNTTAEEELDVSIVAKRLEIECERAT